MTMIPVAVVGAQHCSCVVWRWRAFCYVLSVEPVWGGDGERKYVGDVTPSTSTGHSVLCPYRDKCKGGTSGGRGRGGGRRGRR